MYLSLNYEYKNKYVGLKYDHTCTPEQILEADWLADDKQMKTNALHSNCFITLSEVDLAVLLDCSISPK